jgi:hypothetical protein
VVRRQTKQKKKKNLIEGDESGWTVAHAPPPSLPPSPLSTLPTEPASTTFFADATMERIGERAQEQV